MAQYEYPNITIEDYQTINHNSQSARYEYLDGELRMLAGGSADPLESLGIQFSVRDVYERTGLIRNHK